MGGLPPADPRGAALRRQGPDVPDRAGQQRRPPPPRPLPPPLQGHLARPPHGRRRPQAALPPAAARELPADARQLPICFWLSVSTCDNELACAVVNYGAFGDIDFTKKKLFQS